MVIVGDITEREFWFFYVKLIKAASPTIILACNNMITQEIVTNYSYNKVVKEPMVYFTDTYYFINVSITACTVRWRDLKKRLHI